MGKYYDDMWRAAVDAAPKVVAVTSYNEWGEGTQIEAAKSGQVLQALFPLPSLYSPLPTPYSLLHTPYSLLHTAYSPLHAPCYLLPTL